MRNVRLALCLIGLALTLLHPIPALAQGRDDALTWFVRGQAAIEMAKNDDDLRLATVEFRKAVTADPTMPEAWYNLGMVQAKTGELDEAIASLNRYLELSPQARDAREVRDEVIKLGYRLERSASFAALSGQWISTDGMLATISADAGENRLTFGGPMNFSGSAQVYMRDVLNKPPTTYEAGLATFDLVAEGSSLKGIFEFTDNKHTDGWCVRPTEKNPVKGTLEGGRMALSFPKGVFRVLLDYEAAPFSQTKVFCKSISPIGSQSLELVFLGPLGDGGLKARLNRTDRGSYTVTIGPGTAAGLADGDEIVAIEGNDVAGRSFGEVIMALRGRTGDPVRLTVIRPAQNGIPASDDSGRREITVTRVRMGG